VARSVYFITTIMLFLFVSPAFSAVSDTVFVEKFKVETMSGAHYYGHKGELSIDGLRGTLSSGEHAFISREEIKTLYRHNDSWKGNGQIIAATIGLILGGVYYLSHIKERDLTGREKATVLLRSAGIAVTSTVMVGLLAAGGKKWEKIPMEITFRHNPKLDENRLYLTFSF